MDTDDGDCNNCAEFVFKLNNEGISARKLRTGVPFCV